MIKTKRRIGIIHEKRPIVRKGKVRVVDIVNVFKFPSPVEYGDDYFFTGDGKYLNSAERKEVYQWIAKR